MLSSVDHFLTHVGDETIHKKVIFLTTNKSASLCYNPNAFLPFFLFIFLSLISHKERHKLIESMNSGPPPSVISTTTMEQHFKVTKNEVVAVRPIANIHPSHRGDYYIKNPSLLSTLLVENIKQNTLKDQKMRKKAKHPTHQKAESHTQSVSFFSFPSPSTEGHRRSFSYVLHDTTHCSHIT